MSNLRIPDAPPGWHSIRPWVPRLSLYVHEITSVSVTFILSCRHVDLEDELGEKLELPKHKISDVLGKGVAVKLNGSPWQRVVMHVDEESDEEAVVILYGLMPSKQYEIELGVVAGESITGNLTTEDELVEASPAVTQLNTTPQTQTVTPADTPPSSPSSSGSSSPPPRQITVEERAAQLRHMHAMLVQEHDQLNAQLKTARRDAQRADAALRSEIEALKRAVEKNAAGEQRAKQKILALQEAVKQALAAAVETDEQVKDLERAIPELELRRAEAEKEHVRTSELAERSGAETKAALDADRKKTAEVEAELAALTAKVEKMSAKRDKLAGESVPELERELAQLRSEIEEIERVKEREEFNHEVDYPHHYAPQPRPINAAAPPFVPRGVGHSRGAGSLPVGSAPVVKPHAHTASEGFLRGYPLDVQVQRPSGQASPTAEPTRAPRKSSVSVLSNGILVHFHGLGWTEVNWRLLPTSIMSSQDIKLVYQAPLTHRTRGPGLVLFLSDKYAEKHTSGPLHLDPPPAQKWAEEGFCVLSVPAANIPTDEWDKLVEWCMQELGTKHELDESFPVGVIVYEPELVPHVLQVAKAFERISCVVAFTSPEHALPVEFSCPVLQHACSWASAVAAQPPVQDADNRPAGTNTASSPVTTYTYALPAQSFVHPHSSGYSHTHAALAHTRTLTFLRKHIGGPLFDIEAIWEAHTRFEFEGRDVEGTMGTMVAEPYVNHIPTLTGGIGRKALTSFYTHHFIHSNPDSTRLELVSRTIGPDRVVDEFNFEFTHDREIDWMLPGVPPTGKHVRVPFVAVVNVRGDKLYHEHIYWDQASVLVQIGLLPERLAFPGTSNTIRLPVYGVDQADKMLDPASKESNLLINQAPRE